MNSSEIIFNVVQKNLPYNKLSKCNIVVQGWDRNNIVRLSPYKTKHNILGKISLDLPAKSLKYILSNMRQDSKYPELGFSMYVHDPDVNTNRSDFLCIPCLDTSVKDISCRATLANKKLWEALDKFFPNKKVYVLDSGNAKHLIVDALCEKSIFNNFLSSLIEDNVRSADLKWAKYALDSHAVLRVTSGQNGRPEPKLDCWYTTGSLK